MSAVPSNADLLKSTNTDAKKEGSCPNLNVMSNAVDINSAKDLDETAHSSQYGNATHVDHPNMNEGDEIVDFVLVFKNKDPDKTDSDSEAAKQDAKEQVRLDFEHYLQKQQHVIVERKLSSDKKNTFVLITIPFERQQIEAEIIGIEVPLILPDGVELDSASHKVGTLWGLYKKITGWYTKKVPHDKPPMELDNNYIKAKSHLFKNGDDPNKCFTRNQQIEMADNILKSSRWSVGSKEVGIDRLILDGYYETKYPMHDGPYEKSHCVGKEEKMNKRRKLAQNWARYYLAHKMQPYELIREYYGEKIAFYFQFMGLYTAWLIPMALMGLIVIIYGIVMAFTSDVVNDICNSDKILCAQSEALEQKPLSSTCAISRLTVVFDNALTLPYTIICTIWSCLFVIYWKRKSNTRAFKWNVWDYEDDEHVRPEYLATLEREKKNPTFWTKFTKSQRHAVSVLTLLVMICLVIAVVFGVICYRLAVGSALSQNDSTKDYAAIITSITAAIINLICIIILESIYNVLAVKLNDWQNHRTETEYEDSLILKMVCFNFVNTYSSIVYVAFFKGKFSGSAANPRHLFGLAVEGCSPAGCMSELMIQLLIIMGGKQAWGGLLEILIPFLKAKFKYLFYSKQKGINMKEAPQYEKDYLLNPYQGLFPEYMEMVLQFGFVCLFAAGLPLAPVLALINNMIEIRSDAQKFIQTSRKPVPYRAQDIGSWEKTLTFIVKLSIVSNAFIIALTSDFVTRRFYENDNPPEDYIDWLYAFSPASNVTDSTVPEVFQNCYYRGFYDQSGGHTTTYYQVFIAYLAFVIIYEHLLFFIVEVLLKVIHSTPKWIQKTIVDHDELTASIIGRNRYYEEDNLSNISYNSQDSLISKDNDRSKSNKDKKSKPQQQQQQPYTASTTVDQEDDEDTKFEDLQL